MWIYWVTCGFALLSMLVLLLRPTAWDADDRVADDDEGEDEVDDD